ncbi:MAG TPA: AAA family ATPase [Solirubrobacteraceae bacterium]|nr:AAA family ATPase [Solirubrobacteraceae bacterium]
MRAGVIGREQELGLIEEFVHRIADGPAALLLSGESGIGKTALWDAGVERARKRRAIVLKYRAVEAEALVPFAALSDLLSGVREAAFASLTAPRRYALEVALLLEEPGERPPDQRAIGLALVDVVRTLSASRPVLVAIDDLQWLDLSTAAPLQFALRRLGSDPVGLLATARTPAASELPIDVDRCLPEATTAHVAIGPLSVGAAYRVLTGRLGLGLSRPELLRLHELTGGNPFYLLEMGRELKGRRVPLSASRPIPVPRGLRELLAERLSRLPEATQEALLVVAATARPTVDVVEAASGDAKGTRRALEGAAAAGVVEFDSSRVRFMHPLLASVCYQSAPPWRQREVHRRLADLVSEPEERARHLALTVNGADEAVACQLDLAAEHAFARGATAAAAGLHEFAAESTPVRSSAQARRRRLRAATCHRLAGDRDRAAGILHELRDQVSGVERADVLFELAQGRQGELSSIAQLCEHALSDAAGDAARCARILGFLSWLRVIEGELDSALSAARDALVSAERTGEPRLVAPAIARVAMAETWVLDITPGLVERGVELERRLPEPLEFHESPTIALARRLICLSELDRARSLLEEAATSAGERGDEGTRGHILFHLIMLEWFAGQWDDALEHAALALELAQQLGDEQFRGMVLHGTALVDAHRGEVEVARVAAEQAAVIAEAVSDAIFPIWNEGVLGHVELSLGHMDAAAEQLGPLPGRLLALGWNDPADSVWPDAIEALVAVGELDRAQFYLDNYEELAQQSGSPWALGVAARCRGMLAFARGQSEVAFAAFDRALSEHDRAPNDFERGRTLLALGSVRRRVRQRAAARTALDQAREMFDAVGARLWAARASDELGRISGRRAGAGLTATEERVARLAAGGRANKEIAAELYMSVHTVEAHLSRVYRKLGIRSRTELAQRLITPADGPVKM